MRLQGLSSLVGLINRYEHLFYWVIIVVTHSYNYLRPLNEITTRQRDPKRI